LKLASLNEAELPVIVEWETVHESGSITDSADLIKVDGRWYFRNFDFMTISWPMIIDLVVMCACRVAYAFFVLYWYYRLRKRRWQQVSAGVFHVFAFQWKPGSRQAQKERAKKDILAFHAIIRDFFTPTSA
jgi:hypothetical protein